MTQLVGSERQASFRKAIESRLGHSVDPDSKAFFYGALSYDHILAVGYAIQAIKNDNAIVNRKNMMRYLRKMDFQGATGRVTLVPGTNDRENMPVQIFNSHGYKEDGKTVNFVSVGAVNAETGELIIDEGAIVWPGGTRQPPQP